MDGIDELTLLLPPEILLLPDDLACLLKLRPCEAIGTADGGKLFEALRTDRCRWQERHDARFPVKQPCSMRTLVEGRLEFGHHRVPVLGFFSQLEDE